MLKSEKPCRKIHYSDNFTIDPIKKSTIETANGCKFYVLFPIKNSADGTMLLDIHVVFKGKENCPLSRWLDFIKPTSFKE